MRYVCLLVDTAAISIVTIAVGGETILINVYSAGLADMTTVGAFAKP